MLASIGQFVPRFMYTEFCQRLRITPKFCSQKMIFVYLMVAVFVLSDTAPDTKATRMHR
jgi:hypothetical protein